jgi:ParB/RepB/Spo0J family partition protein
MKENLELQETFLEIALWQIGHSYGRFRLTDPQADAFMVESVRRYGQLCPVMVGRTHEGGYELVDGFKRFRACKQLGFETLKARVLDGRVHALKACMIHLNWKARSITDLEEALVIQSLYREDGLTQVEIATLLGRHKSWVCRRISLIEKLCDEVVSHLRVGLIRATIGRELARLPRGNQEPALSAILKHRLTCRETQRLISMLLERPRWEHEAILRFPQQILDDRNPPRPGQCSLRRVDGRLHEKLRAIERCSQSIMDLLTRIEPLSQLSEDQRQQLSSVVDRVEQILNHLKKLLRRDEQCDSAF